MKHDPAAKTCLEHSSVKTAQEIDETLPKIFSIDDQPWFIMRVVAGKEFTIFEILNRIGFLAYTPHQEKYRFGNRYNRARRNKLAIHYPLMTGYVFIALHPRQLGWFWKHYKTKSMLSFVGCNGYPVIIDHKTIRAMALRHGNNQNIELAWHRYQRTHCEFSKGDTVNVVDGPFKGFEVKVEDIAGFKASAFVKMFGSQRLIQFEMLDLEKQD